MDLDLVALHEAGHAVAHCLLGWPPAGASIVPNEDSWGRVNRDPARRPPSDFAQVAADLAGPLAVDIFLTRHWTPRGLGFDYDHDSARLGLWCMVCPSPKLSKERDAEVSARVAAVMKDLGNAAVVEWSNAESAKAHPELAGYVRRRVYAACRAVEKLLRRRWPAVVEVAKALLDRSTLFGPEIESIVADSVRRQGPAPWPYPHKGKRVCLG